VAIPATFERRSTGDRPARKEGSAGSGGFRRDAGDRPTTRAIESSFAWRRFGRRRRSRTAFLA
ncbi:hypothetical protein BZM27_24965, partial [Paraburkholderia steynii]